MMSSCGRYWRILCLVIFATSERAGAILIRSIFFIAIVFTFSCIWSVTNLQGASLDQKELVWYISAAELIILSIPLIQFEIESDIRTGNLVSMLTKPLNYLVFKIMEGLGALMFRFMILASLAIAFAWVLSGGWMPAVGKLTGGLAACFLGALAFLFWHAAIGLAAFRMEDCSPFFWIWQRMTLLLGGVMLPIEFYPNWMREAATYTPFPALVFAPGRYLVGNSTSSYFETLNPIVCWMGVAMTLCVIVFNSGKKRIRIHGG